MKGGRAAKFAFDPAAVVAFLDSHTELRTDGMPRRARRYIHGFEVDRDTDARIIRRWRNVAEGLTFAGVDRLLTKFDLSIPEFVAWADARGHAPILRGKLPSQPKES